ncbi:unnamed protein product [Lactuca virosa]|uniref:RING-CH-type domain-containing protein n=1 Tax=Lactuca virosa TaxID=75947 RepID=A0AAU9M3U7_9ASTR|nr:unnamed protein product [Lactuca virosa]
MAELRVNVEEELLYSVSEIIYCRICHEGEFESCKTLETPCSCSGTIKFAHRDCVQRWCDEKGNTNCELCLQKFEPGYSVPTPPPKKVDDTRVTIRGSLEVPSPSTEDGDEEERLVEREYAECSSAADTTASMCRTVAVIFTVLLLVRHFLAVLMGETGDYPFTILTLLVIKASGILLPMYIIMRVIDVVHNSIKRQNQDQAGSTSNNQTSSSSSQPQEEGQDNV